MALTGKLLIALVVAIVIILAIEPWAQREGFLIAGYTDLASAGPDGPHCVLCSCSNVAK